MVVKLNCDCTRNIVDCPILSAGQHVTLHMSLGFVSSQSQHWTLNLISDISNCPSGINSSLPLGHAQHRRKAVYSSACGKVLSNKFLTAMAHAIDNTGIVVYCICYSCQKSMSHSPMLLASRHFKAAVPVSMAVHVDHSFWPSKGHALEISAV